MPLMWNVSWRDFYFCEIYAFEPNLQSLPYLPKFHNIKMNNGLQKLMRCQVPKAVCLFISQCAVCKGNWFILMSHWSTENSIVCHSIGTEDGEIGGSPGKGGGVDRDRLFFRSCYQHRQGGQTVVEEMNGSLLKRFSRGTKRVGLGAQRSKPFGNHRLGEKKNWFDL